MAEEKGEVKIDLVADDEKSKAAVKALKDGLEGASDILEKFVKTQAILAAGILAAVAPMVILGHAALEAADETVKQERAMSGVLGLLDRGAHSAEQVADFAHDMREELEMAGIKAAVPVDQMVNSFNLLIERGGIGAQKAKELTEQMALVGKVSRGGMDALANGFSMMEMGMIRGRNPIVALIASTGVLKGNAQSVARAMQHMTQQHRMELAEAALAKQAANLKANGVGGIQTLDEARASLSGFREMLLDAMGGPIHDMLIPKLNELQGWLVSHADELKDYAQSIGTFLSHFIDLGEGAVKGVYDGIKENWAVLESVADDWRDVMGTTETTSADVRDDFKLAADYIIAAFKLAADTADKIKHAYEWMADAANNRTPGTTQANESYQKLQGMADDYSPEGQKKFDEAAQKYRKLAEEAGFSATKINMNIERLAAHEQGVQGSGETQREEVKSGNYYKFGGELDAAMKYQNDAAAKFQAQLILSSDTATSALADGSLHITGGVDKFLELVGKAAGGEDIAKNLKKAMAKAHGGGSIDDIKGAGPYNDFRGSQFHIKQDFKNENADNIALVFRRDLMKAANARLQANSAPFPGL